MLNIIARWNQVIDQNNEDAQKLVNDMAKFGVDKFSPSEFTYILEKRIKTSAYAYYRDYMVQKLKTMTVADAFKHMEDVLFTDGLNGILNPKLPQLHREALAQITRDLQMPVMRTEVQE